MDVYKAAERLMLMDEAAWSRHAHPISVWTRILLGLPLVTLAIWSRAWIGAWAWLALAGAVGFLLLNPRMAPTPKRTDRWSAKGVFGERVWLKRAETPVPARHRVAPHLLTGIAVAGAPFYGWGLVVLDPWLTLFGAALIYLGKVWFVDRMVWLYEDMKDATPEYRAWLKSG